MGLFYCLIISGTSFLICIVEKIAITSALLVLPLVAADGYRVPQPGVNPFLVATGVAVHPHLSKISKHHVL